MTVAAIISTTSHVKGTRRTRIDRSTPVELSLSQPSAWRVTLHYDCWADQCLFIPVNIIRLDLDSSRKKTINNLLTYLLCCCVVQFKSRLTEKIHSCCVSLQPPRSSLVKDVCTGSVKRWGKYLSILLYSELYFFMLNSHIATLIIFSCVVKNKLNMAVVV